MPATNHLPSVVWYVVLSPVSTLWATPVHRKAVIGGVGQERHIARALDRSGQDPLMLGTVPSLTTGADLATIGHIALQELDLLVVDLDVLATDAARAAARDLAATSASTPAAVVAAARTIL